MTIAGEDLKLFADSLRAATETASGPALDAALIDLGWRDALEADPKASISTLFGLQGHSNATSAALDDVLAGAFGQRDVAVLLPAIGSLGAPGTTADGRVDVRGIGTASLGSRATTLLIVERGAEHRALSVDSSSLPCRPVAGLDPSLGLVEASGRIADASDLGPVGWEHALALGRLAVGHELAGASRRMLELARAHALDRIQFGRPIATFQAVRHRLAETLVAIEAAEALLETAWLDGTATSAAMAKAVAGRSARTAARHCQQVLAGIGYTTEHPLHRYVRRVLVLDQLLGSATLLTRALGIDILEAGAVPAVPPL